MQQVAAPAPEILTVAEAAAHLRLSERKLYALVQARRVPVARIDGRLLFPRRLLDAWLLGHLEGPPVARAAPPVLTGSHDPLLEWAVRESGCSLALLTGGSGDGLQRFARGEAVAAALHLREPDGGYNLAHVRGLGLPDLVLIAWARRRQGLLLPLHREGTVASIADVVTQELRLVRRQSDSGGQVLLRHLLAEAGLADDAVRWAPSIARTDTDLAAAILDGAGDCGVGIEAVARRFRLGFVPLAEERFDLLLRRHDYFEPPIQKLLAFAATPGLADQAAHLRGYDLAELGRVRLNGLG